MSPTNSTLPEAAPESAPGASRPLGSPWNLPNIITLSRLVLALILFALISHTTWRLTATALFVVAAATDFLDGYIARKYGLVTILGRILDPFVDKVIICGAFLFLVAQNKPASGVDSGVTDWMALVVMSREMFVTGLRSFLEQQGKDFSAVWSGKIKMVVQCVAVTASLLSLDSHFATNSSFLVLRDVLLWAALVVTLYSGWVYALRAAVLLRPR
jgi:CDP-diacylglycerol--glycerol-3-phosphate 3-phosphatidyltransferase